MEYMPKEKEQTKSKWLALFLAWACQLHLLYLGRPGEMCIRDSPLSSVRFSSSQARFPIEGMGCPTKPLFHYRIRGKKCKGAPANRLPRSGKRD